MRESANVYNLPLSALVAAEDEGTASWGSTTHVAKQGDNFSVTCTVTNVQLFDLVQIERQDPETEEEHNLANRQHVQEPFLGTNRYNVTYTHNLADKTVTVQLHFKGK